MKIKPEVLLNNVEALQHKNFLVTGLDEPLISHVTEFIIKNFKEKNYFIDYSGNLNGGLSGDLFSDKKILFVLKDYSLKDYDFENVENENQSILIFSSNAKKTNNIKGVFLKSKKSLLVECYSLNRAGKEMVIKKFIEKNNMQLSNNVYWYAVENFENDYVLLVKQLTSLSLYNSSVDLVEDVEKVVFVENKIQINKIFFQILKNNKILINTYNKNIYSQGDFYVFLSSLKLYLGLICNSPNKEEAIKKFPKYLFNEKDVFIKIYDSLNKNKILKIYRNILKVEGLVRKNSGLYLVIGLRFLINTKKIISS